MLFKFNAGLVKITCKLSARMRLLRHLFFRIVTNDKDDTQLIIIVSKCAKSIRLADYYYRYTYKKIKHKVRYILIFAIKEITLLKMSRFDKKIGEIISTWERGIVTHTHTYIHVRKVPTSFRIVQTGKRGCGDIIFKHRYFRYRW